MGTGGSKQHPAHMNQPPAEHIAVDVEGLVQVNVQKPR
jgi:hypothetical protein